MHRFANHIRHDRNRRTASTPRCAAFTITELLAIVVITSVAVWLIIPRGPVGPPPEYHVERAIDNIQMALTSCVAATGTAPTRVDELPQLVGKYLDIGSDPSRPLAQIINTGRDYWGNSLQIHPDPDRINKYTLRSLGPDGVFDNTSTSDDIVVSYTALIYDTH